MSKMIKLDDQVYNRLENFRNKGETFSEAVERLLEFPRRIRDAINIVKGQQAYQEWLQKHPDALSTEPGKRSGPSLMRRS